MTDTSVSSYNQLALHDDCFKPTLTGLIIFGEPRYEIWEAYGKKLSFVEGAIQWLIGDWLNYGEGKWGEMYAQAVDETQGETWRHYKWVAKAVELCTRVHNLSWAHHREVAALEPEGQSEWLALAQINGWSKAELHRALQRASLSLLGQAFPTGKYMVIYADPPWQYDNTGFDTSAEAFYPTMPTEEICALPVDDLSTEHTVLFLWATNPLLPDALRVMEAWGFTYKTNLAWIKESGVGLGWWLKARHELLLIGVHEKTPHPQTKPDSCFFADRGPHSRKPEIAYQIIESMFPGPRIELFARAKRDGWDAFGNEVGE